MASRIQANAGETEIVAGRTRNSKSFQRLDGSVRVVNRIHPVHWDNSGTWTEVDMTPTTLDGGKTWTTTSTPYILSWDARAFSLNFQSKSGGDVQVRLVELNGVPFAPQLSLPSLSKQSIKAFVAPELELELRIRSHEVEILKILHGPTVPTSLTWEVIAGDLTDVNLNLMNTSGRDNTLNSAARKLGDPLNRSRLIEMTHSKSPDDLLSNPGKITYRVTESFTGRTRFIDPITRVRSWVNEVKWPVEIDVTITTNISADDDDGRSAVAPYWAQSYIKNDTVNALAVRFKTVNVPQGQTLDSAILTYNVTSRSGSETSTLSGEGVDSAAEWTNHSANGPLTMAATTANVTLPAPASTGIKTLDVKSICQEIINRAGWVANNNIRLGVTNIAALTTSYQFWEDYNAAGTDEVQLDIIYTAAGGAANPIWIANLDGIGSGGPFPGHRVQ